MLLTSNISNHGNFSLIYLLAIILDCLMGIIVHLNRTSIKKRPSLDGLFLKVLTPCSLSVNFCKQSSKNFLHRLTSSNGDCDGRRLCCIACRINSSHIQRVSCFRNLICIPGCAIWGGCVCGKQRAIHVETDRYNSYIITGRCIDRYLPRNACTIRWCSNSHSCWCNVINRPCAAGRGRVCRALISGGYLEGV